MEELVRITNGYFLYKNQSYQLDLAIARGECIGIFVDDHITSGSAYHGIFNGSTQVQSGKCFLYGKRVGIQKAERWLQDSTVLIDKNRFTGKVLNVQDYLIALDAKKSSFHRIRKPKASFDQKVQDMLKRMHLKLDWMQSLDQLSILDYYKLWLFKAWFSHCEIIVLNRMTEILRKPDVREFMRCVQILQEQGISVLLLDMDEDYMFAYSDHIDVVRDQHFVYHLYPEEYEEYLHSILGWEDEKKPIHHMGIEEDDSGMLSVRNFTLQGLAPMNFEIRAGEIGVLIDDNYKTGKAIEDCFMNNMGWMAGSFRLNGKFCDKPDIAHMIGKEIGVQIALPDRKNGVLFENLTALENLTLSVIPKAGKHLMKKGMINSILSEATEEFDRHSLLQPLRTWAMPERLHLSYYRWYLLNPQLLICLFPFSGQESIHLEMIIEMLVMCAKRGMAVWLVSSNIDAICEDTENYEFLERLRFLNF